MAVSSAEPAPREKAGLLTPPRGLAILAVLGPGLVWCGEYIGSGEVILASRTGALLGIAVLWAPTLAIFAKLWVGVAGARYTVCTGEGMIDMMSRTPGPRNWVIWPVLVGQLCSGAIATAAIAATAGMFASYFIPVRPFLLGWLITIAVIALVWSGKFEPLKKIMSLLVALIIVGVVDVAVHTWPGFGEIFRGLFSFRVPDLPEWAKASGVANPSPWKEILPLLGWAAGGFASQVWYTYWVIGAGYGMTRGRNCGEPLDPGQLRALTADDARSILGWCRVVYADAAMAATIGIVVTSAFFIAGAGVLGSVQLAPEGNQVALELSRIFSDRWGMFGARLFMLSGLAAMVSTLFGQLAGWPRLLADCSRVLVPAVKRFSWHAQFRAFLIAFTASNMIIVYTFGVKPVFLVKLGAIVDGLLLTPLQALAVGLTLYFVMPKFFSEEVRKILKPHPVFAAGLLLAFLVFGFFCITQFGEVVRK